jgi:hypothetical protein
VTEVSSRFNRPLRGLKKVLGSLPGTPRSLRDRSVPGYYHRVRGRVQKLRAKSQRRFSFHNRVLFRFRADCCIEVFHSPAAADFAVEQAGAEARSKEQHQA